MGVFKRVLDNIVFPLWKTVSLCNFGPQHGKFLYDGSGRTWVERYRTKCVAEFELAADDLLEVFQYMNNKFAKPVSGTSGITKRITL